ncbi:hypothetical protein [Dactylosporangium sp. NPDC051541]|uniref:hypothetical protein n=1 Tax=Dactylosporangium sp. NPDC051541 TaxID=3363977 RepID=UPI0037AC61A2
MKLVRIPQPRPLTPGERRALTALVEHADRPGLRAQLASAQVIGKCDCGCASVQLSTTGPKLPDTEWLSVNATGDGADVVLHVIEGRLHELECYAGEGVAVALPDELRDFWVGR